MLFLIQTAVAVAPAPVLSLGEWLAIIAAAVAIGGVVYRTGVNTAETRHVKSSVDEKLSGVLEKLEKIAEFIEESMKLRVAWADWRGTTTQRIEEVAGHAEEAKDVAHKARGIAQGLVIEHERLDARVKTLERFEEDRRIGPPDRRQH